ncbi:hypothetical protein [Bacteroides finegoldii]|nr:hypothetical protein [Bacteroides finegoldii]EEX46648.1 hypothetical protein BACFIN_05684 [Bacteroides finegoldii DSM 17565]
MKFDVLSMILPKLSYLKEVFKHILARKEGIALQSWEELVIFAA